VTGTILFSFAEIDGGSIAAVRNYGSSLFYVGRLNHSTVPRTSFLSENQIDEAHSSGGSAALGEDQDRRGHARIGPEDSGGHGDNAF